MQKRASSALILACTCWLFGGGPAAADVAVVKAALREVTNAQGRGVRTAVKALTDLDIGGIGDAVLEDASILSTLGKLTGDDRPVVSKAAEGVMKRLGGELGTRIPDVLTGDAKAARKLIGTIGDLGDLGSGATGMLIDVVSDGDLDRQLRIDAIDAIGDIGFEGADGAARKALEVAARDGDANVSGAAKKALGKLK